MQIWNVFTISKIRWNPEGFARPAEVLTIFSRCLFLLVEAHGVIGAHPYFDNTYFQSFKQIYL